MTYELKLLDDSLKQSHDTKKLNIACIYYKELYTYLCVMKETNNTQLFFKLLDYCYKKTDTDAEEDIIDKAIDLATSTYMMGEKPNPMIPSKRESLLKAIEDTHFNEERLNKDIDLARSLFLQYQIILLGTLEENEQKKRLNK